MNTVIPVIAIPTQDASASQGTAASCGHCLHSSAGSVCHVELSLPAPVAPELQGPPELLARLLASLDEALDLMRQADGSPMPMPRSGLIRSLSVVAGEATLVLAVAPRCGGAQLAQTAFHALRRQLPDTDIYVQHLPG